MGYLQIISAADLASQTNTRPGETKLGEGVQAISGENWEEDLRNSSASIVMLGIPEDLGVKANLGLGGAASLWEPALRAILNVQETDRLQGNQLLVLGAFDFASLLEQADGASVSQLREMVSQIDDLVFPVIKTIIDAGKLTIIIGGGHNNAYPVLKGL